jgi:signal transduction histidine kinase/Tfp pilus assembly protein PilF
MLLLVSLLDERNMMALPEQSDSRSDDSSRFETLMDLAGKTSKSDSEQAIEYAEQALSISERMRDKTMIARAQFMVAWTNYDAQNYHKSIEYGKLCESFFEKSDDYNRLAGVYNLLSSAYFCINNPEMSDMYSDKSIETAEKYQILDILNKQYYNRGAIAFYRGDYSRAMVFALKALDIAKKNNNPGYMAYCYDLMGNLSLEMLEYRKAIDYIALSREIYLAEGDKKSIGQNYYNTANIYIDLKQLDSSRLYYRKALEYYREAESADGLSLAYAGLARCHNMNGKLDSAQIYIEKGLKSGLLSESKKDLSIIYSEAGVIFAKQGDHQKAMGYYRKALALANQTGNKEMESIVNQDIGRSYAALQQPDSAYRYLSQAVTIKDSLNRPDDVQKSAYAFAEHNIKEGLEKEKEVERQKRQSWLIIMCLCIIVIAILSIFIRSLSLRQRKIKSINAELSKYKSDLEHILQDKTRKLILSEQQILNLSNNLPNGAIFRFAFENEREGQMLYVSSGWEELTGQSIEVAKDAIFFFQNRIHPDDSRELLKALAHAIHNRTMLDMVYRFYKNNTELRWFHIRAVAIAGDDGLTYLDGYQVDETMQKHFEQELVAAKDKAEESDKLKSAFLANMSHEIRTPMNVIIGFSALLSNAQLPPERQHTYLELIQENCQNLLRLIDDIVDISKIEADQLDLRMETFPLSKIMTSIKEYFEPIIDAKYPFVEFWIDENSQDSPLIIHADVFRLKQIFVNLIENALKFTEKGFVRCGHLLDRPGVIHFYVMDTGAGISHENIETIFQNFRKLDQYSSGTGLGLSIVKRLLLQMGGVIWVESEPGVGSTFHFTLPLTK